jgi:peptide/nickel transport system permease protein
MMLLLARRLLAFVPTLLVISWLAFALSKLAPGDPVELIIRAGSGAVEGEVAQADRIYRETAGFLGLDKPAFYFTLSSQAFPDTLYRIVHQDHRHTLRRLIAQYGYWPPIERYYLQLRHTEVLLSRLPRELTRDSIIAMRRAIDQLYLSHEDKVIVGQLEKLRRLAASDPGLQSSTGEAIKDLSTTFQQVRQQARRWKLFLPALHWHGFDNQYHHWFFNFFRGDFGTSYIDGRPVASKLNDALRWTLIMNLMAILLAYALAIPLGVYTATRHRSRLDQVVALALFMLYSLPSFWIATLLVVFITTPEYGLDWFPTMGVSSLPREAPFWARFWDTAHHLTLPIFCLTYGSLAFITRQVRGAMLNTLSQDYVRTARAKGLSESAVVWKHAFRNALFPLITMIASIFPAILAGSIVIEIIFNIPGMGYLTVEAITQRNWPVVYSVLMLGAVLTMAGILLADILYLIADPRVGFGKEEA